jgi:hypothetical protein
MDSTGTHCCRTQRNKSPEPFEGQNNRILAQRQSQRPGNPGFYKSSMPRRGLPNKDNVIYQLLEGYTSPFLIPMHRD